MSQRRSKRPPPLTVVRMKGDSGVSSPSSASVDDGAVCPVCHEGLELFAVGHCDHPICFKCSTRMRMLCDQFYCAICRADMPKVLFVKTLKKFDSFKLDSFCIFREKGLFFEDESIKSAFDKLLENRCGICNEDFRNFKALEIHLKRQHERHFCDLCVGNLKLFSCDRKFYERKQLAEHKRLGDADDKSYRQHPLCKFCDVRYFDNDELLRHLRKDHFFCHFCESDGLTNEYFQEYNFLRDHFREKHFLCEQDGCANVEFTNAFRSNIDLKAHVSKTHGSNLGRQQARQLRAIEVDFNFGPRPNTTGRRFNDRPRGRGGASGFEDRQAQRNQQKRSDQRHREDQEKRSEADAALALTLSLAEAQNQGSVCLIDPQLAQQSLVPQGAETAEKKAKTDFKPMTDDFPILYGKEQSATSVVAGASGVKESQTGNADSLARIIAIGVGHSVGNSRWNEAEFPVLGVGKSSGVQKSAGIWSKGGSMPVSSNQSTMPGKAPGNAMKVKEKRNDFPAPGTANTGSEWTLVASQNKNTSVAPSSSGFHKSQTAPNLGDFPVLGKPSNGGNVSSATWVKAKEKKVPEQPAAKVKRDGLIKLETKKKIGKSSDSEEAKTQNVAGVESHGVNEFDEKNGNIKKETKMSLARIASMLSGSQKENEPLKDETVTSDLSRGDKMKSHKKQKDVKSEKEQPTTKKDKNRTAKETVCVTEKAAIKQDESFQIADKEKTEKKRTQEDTTGRKKTKNKGNGKTTTVNFKELQLEEKSPEANSGVDVFEKGPVAEGTALLATTDVSNSQPKTIDGELNNETTKSSSFEAEKSEDTNVDERLGEYDSLSAIEDKLSQASSVELCLDDVGVENLVPKFLPSDFPSLVSSNGVSHTVTSEFSGTYEFIPLPATYSFNQVDIQPGTVNDISRDFNAGLPLAAPPPGFTSSAPKPPPGFAPIVQVSKPPPGFSKPLISEPDKVLNDINVSNIPINLPNVPIDLSNVPLSLSNVPNLYSLAPSYIPPKQFHERLAKFAEVLTKNAGNSFAHFSLLSSEFQSHQITAKDYYDKCSEVMGPSAFQKVFPELVALLPSIEKQQELLRVHREQLAKKSEDIRKGWKPWCYQVDGLIPCSYCGQIVLNDDSLDHMIKHGSDDFPMLK